jgi:hypothetical protein
MTRLALAMLFLLGLLLSSHQTWAAAPSRGACIDAAKQKYGRQKSEVIRSAVQRCLKDGLGAV